MNFLLKASTSAALILILGGTAAQTYAQRCGGDFVYVLRNQKGELIDDKEKVDARQMSEMVHLVKFPIDEKVVSPDEHAEWVKVLRIQTQCGRRFAEAELEYENQKMVLRFLNMPPETNFFLDSLPFQEGTFEIDFKSDMYLKNQKLNRDGLRHTGGKYFQRGTAKTGLLVAAENWTKTTR